MTNDVARIVRGLRDRIATVEQSTREDGIPNLLRRGSDTVVGADAAKRTVHEATPGGWDATPWSDDPETTASDDGMGWG